jgi:hypothetical protein
MVLPKKMFPVTYKIKWCRAAEQENALLGQHFSLEEPC